MLYYYSLPASMLQLTQFNSESGVFTNNLCEELATLVEDPLSNLLYTSFPRRWLTMLIAAIELIKTYCTRCD